MSWSAQTNFAKIGVGTSLFVIFSPQANGDRPACGPDVDLHIETPLNRFSARTGRRVGDEIELILKGDQVWLMSRRRPDEMDSGCSVPGMYGEDWIIRRPG